MTKPSYEERTFPIQRGTPIPWALAEVAYRTYAARHSGQSLERLAERGGFGWHEFLHFYFGDGDWKLADAQVEERWKADKEQQLTTELARVRGLLQRLESAFRSDSPTDLWSAAKEVFAWREQIIKEQK